MITDDEMVQYRGLFEGAVRSYPDPSVVFDLRRHSTNGNIRLEWYWKTPFGDQILEGGVDISKDVERALRATMVVYNAEMLREQATMSLKLYYRKELARYGRGGMITQSLVAQGVFSGKT